MSHRLFRVKALDRLLKDAEEPERQLKRALGPVDLIALGIGAIIGAGIFATTGTAAAGGAGHLGAGPALILSYVLTAVTCGFAALCYAEFAAMLPISGSAYTYAYATLGELVAWIIGWDLILEYAVGNIAVAISWSGYFRELLSGFGLHIPAWLATDYRSALLQPDVFKAAPRIASIPIIFNLPAVLIVVLVTWLLVRGIKESARANAVMVVAKLAVLLFFILVGAFYVKPDHWTPFAPNGWAGVRAGAAIAFFAYIGFDAVSTTAEETRNPQRNLPIGMIGSLIICTVLYIAVAAVLTGLIPYQQLNVAEPLALALNKLDLTWAAGIVSLGAVMATTAVLLVFQLGQARIFFTMSRDGLLPPWFGRVHPTYRTPHVTTILAGLAVAVFAAFANINEIVELTNIGTLFAFTLVCVGIIILRRTDPQRPRPFRCPWSPWVPLLGAIFCVYLMLDLPRVTWYRFAGWLLAGLIIYLLYSRRHSKLNAP